MKPQRETTCEMNYLTIHFRFFSTGSGQIGTGQFGTGQTGSGQFGTGQTAGGNQGSSSNTGGKLLSMISCTVQFISSFEEAASIGFSVKKKLFLDTDLKKLRKKLINGSLSELLGNELLVVANPVIFLQEYVFERV